VGLRRVGVDLHGLKTRATNGAFRGTGLQPVRTTPELDYRVQLSLSCMTFL